MNPMMTQHLGQRPGRARLGAVDHRYRIPSLAVAPAAHPAAAQGPGVDAASWRREASAPTTHVDAAVVANAVGDRMGTTTGLGFCSIKHTARHLGTRST